MIYSFGTCRLDTQTHELRRGEQLIPLQPKVFQVLTYLITHRNRLVTKQELLEHLWMDQFVNDSVVARCIMAARKAIGTSRQSPPSIITLRSQGYRFVRDVTEHHDSVPPGQSPGLPGRESTPPDSPLSARGMRPDSVLSVPSLGWTQGEPLATDVHTLEQKWVTALCCTLAGIQQQDAASHTPAERQHLLHTFLDLAVPEIRRYGGTLQYVTQESVLALFGVPMAYEDHAMRAVRAALGLRRCLQTLYAEEGLPAEHQLGIRLGLHTGLMMVGQVTGAVPMSYAAGDVTDTAMQLAAETALGTIAASAVTADLVRHNVHLTTGAPSREAERPELHPIAHILALATPPARVLPRGETEHTSFVGRQRELATLQRLWTLAQQGRGQVVQLVGAPGLGKSRLVDAFCQELSPQSGTYLKGECVSYGHLTACLLIRELLRQWCGITEEDPQATIQAKVRQSLQAVGMAPENWACPLLQLLGIAPVAEAPLASQVSVTTPQLFEAWQQLLLNASRQRPIVLVLEALHWIDPASAECLTSLIDRLASAPILLLLTFRPGYCPAWMGKSYATQIALHPLSLQESRRLVRSLFPKTTVSPLLLASMVTHGQGNPLFLEELARHARLHPSAPQLGTIPATLHAVLTARLDRLPLAEKHMLQIASALGTEIPFSVFQAVTALPDELFRHSVTYLQNTELLQETRLLPEPAYAFTHSLMQAVVYATLPLRRRQQLHARILQVYREHFPDRARTQPAQMAQHYTAAGHHQEAAAAWQQAVQEALGRAAYTEAVGLLTQGRTGLQQLPDTPELARQDLPLCVP